MDFTLPPPVVVAPPALPPTFNAPPPMSMFSKFNTMNQNTGHNNQPWHHHNKPYFKQNLNTFHRGGPAMTQDDFDGKRLRKSVMRKTVDYNSSIIRALEARTWQRDHRDRRALQPESIYVPHLMPPPSYLDNPSNAITTRFVKTATNKMRCPIFTLAWTPEGRRLVTGASSGEFTLWNGLTFNFETILQAHNVPVRTMVWSHNDNWMVTADHGGFVKYWQSNMNNVKFFQAHKDPIRGISFSPSDAKFATCSDDGTVRVWDFLRCQEENILRGHGADVKCVQWHPQKSLIVSGSKDNQQPVKLWDPKSGQALATLHAHKSTVMDLKWNDNGNWLVTASRDHLLKLFDLRNLKEEIQVFRGHKKEASAVSWHPVHEGMFASGGSDGSILFWNVGTEKEIGGVDTAHESIVWTLAWHPLGHILCSGSNDHTIKFWTRNRPGDQMRDKYNLNTLPAGLAGMDDNEYDEHIVIPGMGPEDKIDITESLTADRGNIPGLDLDTSHLNDRRDRDKKVPYSKPIPRNFQAHWNDSNKMEDGDDIKDVISQIVENTGAVPLQKIIPSAIIVYGRVIQVCSGSKLEKAILDGPDVLDKFIHSGDIEELADVLPHIDDGSNYNNHDDDDNANDDDSAAKRPKVERDSNPKFIYGNNNRNNNDNNSKSSSSGIPSLLNLNIAPPKDMDNEMIMVYDDDEEEEMSRRRDRDRDRSRDRDRDREDRRKPDIGSIWQNPPNNPAWNANVNAAAFDIRDGGGGNSGGGMNNNNMNNISNNGNNNNGNPWQSNNNNNMNNNSNVNNDNRNNDRRSNDDNRSNDDGNRRRRRNRDRDRDRQRNRGRQN